MKSYFKKIGKNTKRKVSEKTKREVLERDWWCVIQWCTSWMLERTPHHSFFGWEANYWPDRNDANQLVTICLDHHRAIHDKWDRKLRQYCKEYLDNLSN